MSLSAEKSRKSLSVKPLRIMRDDRSMPVAPPKLQQLAMRLYQSERIPVSREISLVFCSDATIRSLNACYRGIDRPTDVLSFSFSDPDLLGEIYISLPTAIGQAKEYGTSLHEEITRLLVHGFFHLLGHDHKKTSDRLEMEKKERPFLISNG
jgi:probable rRNA maturation factor